MSRQLIARSADLRKLEEEGFDIDIVGSHLIVRDVPYVNTRREVARGILMSPLTLAGDVTVPPDNHTMMFIGEYPCDETGVPIEKIRNADGGQPVSEALVPSFIFSAKPLVNGGHANYVNYHHKVVTYVGHLEGPAQVLDPEADARTYPVREAIAEDDSPFRYLDTAAGRAGLNLANQKLALGAVAIVGLGGTGSYVLDLVAKTPVRNIHLFDGDSFMSHNAFRAPGAATLDELRALPKKVDYLRAKYDPLRTGLHVHPNVIDADNVSELEAMDFVFICIDNADARGPIVDALETYGKSFIDVGMGVNQVGDEVGGILRVTTSWPENRAGFREHTSFQDARQDDDYDTDIQVADLNALNATLAVIRWKKWCKFYRDYRGESYASYTTDTNMLLNGDDDA